MDALDSRSLRYVDCFGKKFSASGQVRYRITTAAGAWLPVGKVGEEEVFTIDVKERKEARKEGRQYDVTVLREGRRLVADPPHLEIEAGSIVIWHTPDSAITGFTVRGEGAGGAFDSSALTSEAVYTHAFGTPGDYQWVDENGGPLKGLVQVRALEQGKREEFEKWVQTLNNGTLITINGDKATPDRVQILVGQTVFWAVEKAPGISITDARLGRGARRGGNPSRKP
ncbi:MAG: hypothetical protein HYU86_09950 [Chloroflexi bacterium]|nr:hypothetical protein [Chloroflexota bacterium]